MNDDTINIRDIQHYMYCPRRYALLSINGDWSENAFVVKANIQHEHVHDGSHRFSDSRKVVRSGISVYNDLPEYSLFGVCDCVEFIRNGSGVEIPGQEDRYIVRLVEYKPTAPKGDEIRETDAIQVFAQKICADFVWKCDSEAYLYYNDKRRRVKLPFDTDYDKYDKLLKEQLAGMRKISCDHTIPARRKGQKCSGCSIEEVCFYKSPAYSVKDIVLSNKGDDNI